MDVPAVDRRVNRIHQVPLFFQMWWLRLVSVRRVTRRRVGSVCMVGYGVSSDDPVVLPDHRCPTPFPAEVTQHVKRPAI